MMNPLLGRITIDPNVCFGKPCIRCTRIWVSLLLDFLASGMTPEEILEEYPQLAFEESLSGTPDEPIYRVCQEEQRCLVTLDLDFSNVLRFPPEETGGIVVLRMPRNPSLAVLEQLVRQFLNAVSEMSVQKQLWIIELGRVRIHQSRSDFEEDAR